MGERTFKCSDCSHKWTVPFGRPRPANCPQCGSSNIHRAEEDRGYARRGRGHCGRGYVKG